MHINSETRLVQRGCATSTGWWRLNAVDCSIYASTTDRTQVVRPRRVPVAVADGLSNMDQLTRLFRDSPERLQRFCREAPMPEGDPLDFPVDPLGICLWPWRKALWRAGWDAWIARIDHPRVAVLVLGAWPDAARRDAAFG